MPSYKTIFRAETPSPSLPLRLPRPLILLTSVEHFCFSLVGLAVGLVVLPLGCCVRVSKFCRLLCQQIRDPTTLAVLFEDSAACVGVLIAIVGTGLVLLIALVGHSIHRLITTTMAMSSSRGYTSVWFWPVFLPERLITIINRKHRCSD